MKTLTENKFRNWYHANKPGAEKYLFIGIMIALSIFSRNFVIVAILLTALYLKK